MAPSVVDGMPSKDRIESGSVNIPLGEFPVTATSKDIDAGKVATEIVDAFNDGLAKRDYESIANLFLINNSYWRDHLALSFALRTLKGRNKILEYLKSTIPLINIKIGKSSAFRGPTTTAIDAWGEVTGVQFYITFETETGTGEGVVRVAEEDEKWKIFTFFTTLQELNGIQEPINGRRTKGVDHGTDPNRKNWREKREAEASFETDDPTVLVIGAGQGGLTAASRLKMLNVNALIIDSNDRVGDNWRKRYHQLVLHDPIWYDHMPYLNFPSHWPVFTPKDKLAEFFEAYVRLLELNVWTNTVIVSSSWDDKGKKWTVKIERKLNDGTLETRTIHPHHIIQATGHSGKKNFPSIKGMDTFKGRLCHSSEFPGAEKDSIGKKAIVVGSCNSGHDIAQDFFEKGYDITMIQRSTTCVVSSSSITDIGLKGLYEEDGPPVDDADLWFWSFPSELLKAQQTKMSALQNKHDQATLDGLRKAGFGLDNGPDDAGLIIKYFERGGGYYIDVGASQLIVDGKIKVKQGQEIKEILPNGIKFADGSELEADEIIFATGYQNMRTQARTIFGDEFADRVGDVWGFNEEGEFRTIWQDSGHPGFWFMGGNLAICRYFSRILALQIKARELGLLK